MRTLATAIAGVFAPTILRLYANNDHSEMVRYTKSSIRLIAVLLLLPIPLIFGFSKSILSLWIGNDVGAYAPLLMIMLIHLPISLSYLPLHNINIATNSVRLPGIVQIMAGALNLILAIVLCQIPRLGMYGLAIAGAAVLFLRNVVFTPLYAARVLNRPLFTFMKQVLPISAFSILACIASYFLASLTHPISWTGLAISSGPFLIAYCFVAYFFVLNRSERLRFMDILTKFRNRIWRTNAS
jgi:membrane protein EpsK